jgi:hypothetical protein
VTAGILKSLLRRHAPVLLPIVLLVISTLYILGTRHFSISVFTLGDADTLMRLAYIREIRVHGWQGGFFDRNNAPYGMVLHWTKPVYYIIIAVSRCFWFLPPDRALTYAGFWCGPLFALITAVSAYWMALGCLTRWFAATASAAIVMSSMAMAYSLPGSANHHALVLMIALLLGGFGLRSVAGLSTNAWLLGGAIAGIGLWISFESFFAGQMVLVFMLYLWVLDGRARLDQALSFATAFGVVTLMTLAVDPPYGGIGVSEVDRLSRIYFTAIACELAVIVAARYLPLRHPLLRALWLVAGGAVSLGVMYVLFPGLRYGVAGQINPIVRTEWQAAISEMVPIGSPAMLLLYLGNGMLGLGLGMMFLPTRIRYHIAVLLLLAVLLVAGQAHVRLTVYAWAAGTVLTLWYLQRFDRWYGGMVRGTRSFEEISYVLALPVICAFVIFGFGIATDYLFAHPANNVEAELHEAPADKKPKPGKGCSIGHVLQPLTDPAFIGDTHAIVASDFDLSQAILYWTDLSTLAANYHSDPQGINDEILMFRDMGDATAHNIIDERGIRYILICPSIDRNRFGALGLALYNKYFRNNPEFSQPTFFTRLTHGDTPEWLALKPWPEGTKSSLMLFEVRDSGESR